MKFSATWKAIGAFFNFSAEQAEAEEMTAERIGQLDQAMTNLKSRNEDLETNLQTAGDKIQEFANQLAAEKTAHAETKKQLEDLKAEDAAAQISVNKDKDKITGEGAGEVVTGFDKVADNFLGK